jgi:hypothetical protein
MSEHDIVLVKRESIPRAERPWRVDVETRDDSNPLAPDGGRFRDEDRPLPPDAESEGGILTLGDYSELSTELNTPIYELDRWLTAHKNRPALQDLLDKIGYILEERTDVTRELLDRATTLQTRAKLLIDAEEWDWWNDRYTIEEALLGSVLGQADAEYGVRATRLMLVFGLLELLVETPERIKTPADVYYALRWRTVAFPKEYIAALRRQRNRFFVRSGFDDLYVVRDEWSCYEPGEIAHIENVLAGETKERLHQRTTETEEITVTDIERQQFDERDSQSTERFELSEQASIDIATVMHIDGKIDTSGQYGPTHVDTHLGGSLDYSVEQSEERATTQAREAVARAVTRVEQRVREMRQTRTLVQILERNKHKLENPNGEHINGVYRWVDKVQQVQVFRYPNRYLLEFEVPEPAAWLRWLADKGEDTLRTREPDPLTHNGQLEVDGGVPLTPDHIRAMVDAVAPQDYLQIGGRYHTRGLKPPPAPEVVAVALKRDSPHDPGSHEEPSDKEPIRFATEVNATVPDGYKGVSWEAAVLSWFNSRFPGTGMSLFIAVGNGLHYENDLPKELTAAGLLHSTTSGLVGDISSGTIPVAVMTNSVYGYAINVTVTCEPLPETYRQWQIDTYNLIVGAYDALKSQHDEERAAREIQRGVEIQGSSPGRNAENVREELKKLVIEMLSGQDFRGKVGLTGGNGSEPEVALDDPNRLLRDAAEIQFVEQAFEWENLTYVLYPYFWADHAHWDELAPLEGADPNYVRFLRAGSARVVIPARPTFETQVQLYADSGILWGGGPVPGPREDGYLSVADEIKAQQQPPPDGVPGDSWTVRLPTTLLWLGDRDEGMPVVNQRATLPREVSEPIQASENERVTTPQSSAGSEEATDE